MTTNVNKLISRREFLLAAGRSTVQVTAAASLAQLAMQCSTASLPEKPNIIVIMADDLGFGDLGCYGQQHILTPNLDRLAAEGIRFTDFYAGGSVCTPSRRSIMTGKHTGNNDDRIDPHDMLETIDTTVADVLKKAGYATCAIGKWGLSGPGTHDENGRKYGFEEFVEILKQAPIEQFKAHPNDHGFDHFFGYLHIRHAHEYYPDFLWRNRERIYLDNTQYSHDLCTQETLEFIRQNHQDPFFIYLPYTIPHGKYQVPSLDPYENKPWPDDWKKYASMITRMDRDIGKMTALLDSLGIGENTILFFTSDNGGTRHMEQRTEYFRTLGGLRGSKSYLYEGGIRAPMIVRWKGHIDPGQVSNQVWAHWDVLPTAAELAGVKPPDDISGISMVPALFGNRQKQHDYLYWEIPFFTWRDAYRNGFKQAARIGYWKGVRTDRDRPIELYNLETDEIEQWNIADKHPDIVAQFRHLFDETYYLNLDGYR